MTDYTAANTWPKDIPFITRVEARKATTALVKAFGKAKDARPNRQYDMRDLRVRTCWICLSNDPTTLHKGWRRLVHDVSHRVHQYRYPNKNPHGSFHSKIEADMVAYVIDKGWLSGSLKPKKKPKLSTNEKRAKKLKAAELALKRWQSKAKLAATKIRKYRTAVRRLEKLASVEKPASGEGAK